MVYNQASSNSSSGGGGGTGATAPASRDVPPSPGDVAGPNASPSATHPPASTSASASHDIMGILSFKQLVLELGPLDFGTDQEFIEAVIAYMNALPMADLWQDEAWRRRVDAMQGGGAALAGGGEESLRSDEALAQAGHGTGRDVPPDAALRWLTDKEAAELELLRGQSSMWFYLEDFELSDIFINVTLALSTNFNAGNAASRVGAGPWAGAGAGQGSAARVVAWQLYMEVQFPVLAASAVSTCQG